MSVLMISGIAMWGGMVRMISGSMVSD